MNEWSVVKDGRVAILVGLEGNVLAVLCAATILQEPPGSAIRPMGVPIVLMPIAFGTAALAWPFAVWALASGPRRQIAQGIAGMILGASPLFVGFFTLVTLVRVFGHTIKL